MHQPPGPESRGLASKTNTPLTVFVRYFISVIFRVCRNAPASMRQK